MATLVSSYPPLQAVSHGAPNSAPTRDRAFAVALVSALTLLAVAVHGYHPYAEDGGLYLAGVKRLLDPALYPCGAEFVLEPMRFSMFAPMVAALARAAGRIAGGFGGLAYVLLVLHLATTWLTLFAAWLVAERCYRSRAERAGAVVLLACWLDLPVAGTALLLMDPYLTARSLSTPCMVLALLGTLDATDPDANGARRTLGFAVWIGAIVLAAAVHPLMAAYALGSTLVLSPVRSRNGAIRGWGRSSLCAGAVVIALIAQVFAPRESAEYARVAMTRTYWFPAAWQWYELAGLWLPMAILAAFGWRKWPFADDSALRSLTRMAVLAGFCAGTVAIAFAKLGSGTHLVARIQTLREFQVVYFVMILALGGLLGGRVLRRGAWRWAAVVVVLGGTMALAAQATYPASNHLEMPWTTPVNRWERAFLWIRDNTPKDALFALDADYVSAAGEDAQCFRALAERSALPDYSKDGGEASIAPALAESWAAGQAAQQNLSGETDVERISRLRPLGVTWVVLRGNVTTAFDCPYRNGAVQVCRLR